MKKKNNTGSIAIEPRLGVQCVCYLLFPVFKGHLSVLWTKADDVMRGR